MIIEFHLQGSKMLHKGLFDTLGFWVKYEIECDTSIVDKVTNKYPIEGFKLYSHFSFAYFHTEKEIVDLVYARLLSVLRGATNVDIEGVGYFRRLNK